MDFERNSQIKIPSNQIQQKRLYSTYHGNNISVNNHQKVNNLSKTNKLTLLSIPWFVTGFADAEGSFMIVIRKALRNSTTHRLFFLTYDRICMINLRG